MKRMRRVVGGALAAVMLVGSTVSVNAANLKDVFDAEYYAEQYPDLKAAFGNDEKALYQHFLKYGLKEGRVMNPVIDVVKYREQYGDLQTAFGDNWDAYVEHFFTFGVNEKRDSGTDFDMNAYLESYADLKTAFGSDYLSAAKHYMTTGIKENRQEASKEYVRAREEAAKEAEEETENEVETGEFYDENGRLVKKVSYFVGLKSYIITTYEYDTEGNLTKVEGKRYETGEVYSVDTYVDGVRRRAEYYNEGGSLSQVMELAPDGMGIEKLTTYTETEINVRLFTSKQDWYQIYDLEWNFQYQYKASIIDSRYVVDYSVKYDADGNVME